jgi:hypothetical protein
METPTSPEGAKHTPEPWNYQEKSDVYTHYIRAGENEYVCGCGAQDSTGKAERNARRIVQCVNACAGITDPAAHITGLENQLEAWETSAKLRDDGLCPTQRDVIADQQAQIERLESLHDELVTELKNMISVGSEYCDMDMGENGSAAIESARAAIAKVEGGAA